jgi:hypothetical protein
MTAGLAAAKAASILNVYRATGFTAVTPYVKLHIGDPGAAGASNASAVTTRNAATFAAPSAGSMAISSIGTWSMTTSETISHISIWDASTAGNFMESWALTGSVPVVNGSTFSLTTLTLAFTPIAA